MNIEEKNTVLVMLTQTMLGTISSNFRMVVIDLDRPVWPISFYLERESETDREEIEEIISSFEVGMMDIDVPCSGFKGEVVVIPRSQPNPNVPGVKVFLRRESNLNQTEAITP